MKKIVFIELNELNFDFIQKYIQRFPNKYKNLNIIYKEAINTTSEKEYHLLEPWIQWVTIHTGLSAKDHNIFS